MPYKNLITHRLYVRRFTANDLSFLSDLDGDPEVMRHVNGGTPLSGDYIRDKVLPHLMTSYCELGDRGYWATIESTTDMLIGWFYLLPVVGVPESLEIGYRLKRDFWGKGYASEMSQALLAHGFRNPDIRQIEATAMVANGASIRVMEKVGMEFVEQYMLESFPGEDKRAVRYRITQEQHLQSTINDAQTREK